MSLLLEQYSLPILHYYRLVYDYLFNKHRGHRVKINSNDGSLFLLLKTCLNKFAKEIFCHKVPLQNFFSRNLSPDIFCHKVAIQEVSEPEETCGNLNPLFASTPLLEVNESVGSTSITQF